MHEMSLVRSLLRQVGNLLIEHQGNAVSVIRVEMGPLSGVGVDRTLLELAYQQQVTATPCEDANLVIEEVPLSAKCIDCSAVFNIERFRFECPQCNSQQVQIIGGDEFRLLVVDIEIGETPATKHDESIAMN